MNHAIFGCWAPASGWTRYLPVMFADGVPSPGQADSIPSMDGISSIMGGWYAIRELGIPSMDGVPSLDGTPSLDGIPSTNLGWHTILADGTPFICVSFFLINYMKYQLIFTRDYFHTVESHNSSKIHSPPGHIFFFGFDTFSFVPVWLEFPVDRTLLCVSNQGQISLEDNNNNYTVWSRPHTRQNEPSFNTTKLIKIIGHQLSTGG